MVDFYELFQGPIAKGEENEMFETGTGQQKAPSIVISNKPKPPIVRAWQTHLHIDLVSEVVSRCGRSMCLPIPTIGHAASFR
jgi:hypothetical protein